MWFPECLQFARHHSRGQHIYEFLLSTGLRWAALKLVGEWWRGSVSLGSCSRSDLSLQERCRPKGNGIRYKQMAALLLATSWTCRRQTFLRAKVRIFCLSGIWGPLSSMKCTEKQLKSSYSCRWQQIWGCKTIELMCAGKEAKDEASQVKANQGMRIDLTPEVGLKCSILPFLWIALLMVIKGKEFESSPGRWPSSLWRAWI